MTPVMTRWLIYTALVAAVFGAGWIKGAQHEQIKAERFEAVTAAMGRAQAAHAAKINRQQLANLERAKHDINLAMRAAADNAVRNYIARHPRRVCRPDADSGPMPVHAASEPGDDVASGERLATDAGFIEACARDAGRLGVWQQWAVSNGVPVQ